MIEGILPPEVAAVEAFRDHPADLFPEEEACISGAVEERRREFTTARGCARAALGRLGAPPAPIIPGSRRAPQWPAGFVGSITHCRGYRAAAVASARDVAALGIDAEPHAPVPAEVLDYVAGAAERAHLRALGEARPGTCWDRLLFSAKEATYKAWYPLTGHPLEFDEASVSFNVAGGTFTAVILRGGPAPGGRSPVAVEGRWVASASLIATAVVMRSSAPASPPARLATPAPASPE